MLDFKSLIPRKTTLNDLAIYNELVYIESCKKHKVGEQYTSPYFINKEKFYEKDPWEYSINSYGFRGKEWTFEKSPAVFGCSFTFGIGAKQTYANFLEKELQIKNIPNLGVPGGSIQNIIKLFCAFVNHHPISEAVIMLPTPHRVLLPTEFLDKGYVLQNHLPGYPRDNKKRLKAIYEIHTDTVLMSQGADYIEWANAVAKNKGIKIHWGTWDTSTEYALKEIVDDYIFWKTDFTPGRDGYHPGLDSHQWLANELKARNIK